MLSGFYFCAFSSEVLQKILYLSSSSLLQQTLRNYLEAEVKYGWKHEQHTATF